MGNLSASPTRPPKTISQSSAVKPISTQPTQGCWQGWLDHGTDPGRGQGGQCCPQEPWQPSPSPRDSVSGCRGRNALGSREDKIKSLWGVTRQHSRKKDSTVCFLGGLFGFLFYFILLYFWQL